jgi:hypothetical protein
VKYLPAEFVENLRKVFLYEGSRNTPEFRRLMQERYAPRGTKLSATAQRALARMSERFYGAVYPPDPADDAKPFDFSDPTVLRSYMTEAGNLTRAKAGLPEYVLFARAEIGLYQTLHRLRARVRTSRIVRRYLDKA